MSYSISYRRAHCAILAFLVLNLALRSIESKSVAKSYIKGSRKDSMVAMPSEIGHHYTVEHYLQPQALPQTSQYIHYQPTPQVQYVPVEAGHYQPVTVGYTSEQPVELRHESGYNQEAGHELSNPPIQHMPDSGHAPNCTHNRFEYVSLSDLGQKPAIANAEPSSREYPGQILYMSPNEEASKAQASNSHDLTDLAQAVSQGSGMPATILTEIPVRDMPNDVLNKLKREYGVKVVAMRSRPGANLVINCEDYSGRGSSICASQPRSFTTSKDISHYHVASPAVEGHTTLRHSQEEPHIPRENSADGAHPSYGTDVTEDHPELYSSSDPKHLGAQSVNKAATGGDHRVDYGYRNIASEHHLSVHEESNGNIAHPEPTRAEHSETQPEEDPQHAGFEPEPTNGNEPNSQAPYESRQ